MKTENGKLNPVKPKTQNSKLKKLLTKSFLPGVTGAGALWPGYEVKCEPATQIQSQFQLRAGAIN